MFRKHLVIIRGQYAGIAHGAQKVIDKMQGQDDIFLIEESDQCFTVVAGDEDFNRFAKMFMGEWQVSVVKTGQLPDYTNVLVFGKVMDGALQQRAQDIAKKMF
ncbi:hypothetical protein OBP_155 [Pseudomonas phage OBP]|uniref:hypothetical protein n=1 Tax=Pseudomonas phage OBP TaxID=1124849 RepID=UPI000240D570|nr:hypothetical protein OBP_155 [Pseudomonas phage OBP]AEV89592.1 hypothetical protein OBP_155 [Pseudomonas phage OBP]